MSTYRLRVVVVDDEPLARERLRQLLREIPRVRIVAMADDAESAARVIARERPHIVLLDVELTRGADGIGIAAALPGEDPPLVIFVTAHRKYATDAFDVDAVDYVPKPVDPERLAQALDRARARLDATRMPVSPLRLAGLARALLAAPRAERVPIRMDGRVLLLHATEIVRVEAHRNSVHVVTTSGTRRVRGTMTALLNRLPPSLFVRANRSVAVNLDHVRVADPWTRGSWQLTLSDGTVVETSRVHGHALHRVLSDGA